MKKRATTARMETKLNQSSSRTKTVTVGRNRREPHNNLEDTTSTSSISAFFYSILPKDILGVPVDEIRKDLIDSKSQIRSIFSDLFGTSSSQQHTAVVNNPNQSPIVAAASLPYQSNLKSSPSTTANLMSPKSRRLVSATATTTGMTKSESFDVTVAHSPEAASPVVKVLETSTSSSGGGGNEPTRPLLLIDKRELDAVREDGRMQAYGWSLPYKNRETSAKEPVLNISVPVPVYCRPLFQKDTMTQLKLSCASTINYLFDRSYEKADSGISLANLVSKQLQQCSYPQASSSATTSMHHHHHQQQTSCLFESIDASTQLPTLKSSCVWICNINESDTHVSILDANRPSDLIRQFTLSGVRVHCMLSVSGAVRQDADVDAKSEIKLKQATGTTIPAAAAAATTTSPTGGGGDDLDSITYIEFDASEDTAASSVVATAAKSSAMSTLYPTMWLGSQEGVLLVHSSISDVEVTLERVKLKDAILCMSQNRGKVIVGLADGTAAVFTRSKTNGMWDVRSYYLITFDASHHSVRCLVNVNQAANIWCGCRNKIYVLNAADLTISTVIEVHPRKENQVRHLAHVNDGVWVSIRLDSTLRLYHSRTYQQLQYLDIEPFITRMLGTSNLGLSLIRVSSLIIASKRLWIGTGNGVILSIPFNEVIGAGKKPGGVVRVNNSKTDQDEQAAQIAAQSPILSSRAPYCNISDAQFSFHGHRDSVRFFLNVPNLTIQKSPVTPSSSSTSVGATPTQTPTPMTSSSPSGGSTTTTTKPAVSYEKAETLLVVSGGHGYIDFRIGDTANIGTGGSSSIGKKTGVDSDDVKAASVMSTGDSANTSTVSTDDSASVLAKKNDRAYLIVWQINNE